MIAPFHLGGDDLGESDQWSLIFEAERAMGVAVEAADVGEVDGTEFGGGEVVIFAYGPDAEALYRVMEPGLRAIPFRPAHVVLRYGEPADDVAEERIDACDVHGAAPPVGAPPDREAALVKIACDG
ncbi:hypothetical protein [Streptomyces sp. NPDC002265]|uniref:hypothetical protein n=1 Tax=Streptomyces sp. NPDC002265 TaxID=3154415 RepID=UPI00331B5752